MQCPSALKQQKKKVIQTAGSLAVGYKPEKAYKIVEDYLSQIDPHDVDMLLLKGNILDILAEYDRAARVYRKVLRIDPKNPSALINLGDSYSEYKGEHRKGLVYYNRALRLIEAGWRHTGLYSPLCKEDEFIDACVGKADALLELNRPREALRCIVQGLQKYPADILLCGALQRARERYAALQGKRTGKRRRTIQKALSRA